MDAMNLSDHEVVPRCYSLPAAASLPPNDNLFMLISCKTSQLYVTACDSLLCAGGSLESDAAVLGAAAEARAGVLRNSRRPGSQHVWTNPPAADRITNQ